MTRDLEDHVPALLARARALLGLAGGPAGELGRGELAKAADAVSALHDGLVGRRPLATSSTYDSPRHLGAYLLWWWPQTYAKTRAVLSLAKMPPRPRILDLGAGPAPAAIAALDALGGEALAVDASALALSEARALGGMQTLQLDLATQDAPAGPFQLVLAANLLSELEAPRRARLLRSLSGVVAVLEPALRETGRALLELRDELLATGEWSALAPCLTQKPCPALASPRDWCTAERRWAPPRHVVQLAEATGLRADQLLSFAPLVLSRGTALPAEPGLWRVVGVPPPENGKVRYFICNDEGRLPLVRLNKHAAPANAAFEELERGDRVRLSGLETRGDGLRVLPGSRVEKA